MEYKKLIYLKQGQKEALDELQNKINEKGGNVSIMRLINDAVNIFLNNYCEDAIEIYSRTYRAHELE